MIKEAYCSFELSKLLKEKGFDEPCHMSYWLRTKDSIELIHLEQSGNNYSDCIYAPTHQMAMRWLREVYNLYIWIGHSVDKGLSWYYEIHGISDGKVKHIGGIQYGSYEVAVEAALKYSLENLI